MDSPDFTLEQQEKFKELYEQGCSCEYAMSLVGIKSKDRTAFRQSQFYKTYVKRRKYRSIQSYLVTSLERNMKHDTFQPTPRATPSRSKQFYSK